MKLSMESTRLTAIGIASMLFSLSISNPADANNNLKIGIVKHDLTSGFCFAYLPGTRKEMLIIPFVKQNSDSVSARMNINGQNIQIRQISVTSTGNLSIGKYQSQNISLTVESKTVEEREEPSYYSKMTHKISIKSKGITKTINTTGGCNG